MEPYQRTIDALIVELRSDTHRGLTKKEAAARLVAQGRNELTAKKQKAAWRKFLEQFKDVLVIVLLVATAISMVLWVIERKTALPYEAMTIFVVVLVNALIGFVQSERSESAVAALKKMSAAKANVIRDNTKESIEGTEIVPGDLLLVEEGDTIAADARLIQSTALQTAESALTGESMPVSKEVDAIVGKVAVGDRLNMIFSGTAVTSGRGRALVVATGMQTEMGKVAGLLEATPQESTPLQKELDHVGKRLALMVITIAVVMIGTIIAVEQVRGFAALFEVLILGVALAVAAVPEGMPTLVTAVLALGVQRMAKRNAIIRHISAVETLGSATIIASDKTGTLTQNEMTVRSMITASGRVDFAGIGYAPDGEVKVADGSKLEGPIWTELELALTIADRANNAELQEENGLWHVHGDPTEGALITAACKAGIQPHKLRERFNRVGEVPFSSERKLMTTVHTDAEQERILVFTKGAPDVLIAKCPRERVGDERRVLTNQRRTEILALNEGLAGEALRTLAVAVRELPADALAHDSVSEDIEEELVFLGLIGMIDPPRDEAKQAVAQAIGAGIRPIMITGDHPKTAVVIAKELGISPDGRVLIGEELEKLSDAQLDQNVREVSVYARVNPEHKLRIVQALQRGGGTIAMTGDGVNDAPALKTADIGVAMGRSGTDVSKEAADIILTDDNFATIVVAIEEGRAIFSNIRKALRYLLSTNLGEVMIMFFGVVFAKALGLNSDGHGVVLPMLATQILWVNLVTDGVPAFALGIDPAEAGLMRLPPRPRNEGIITGRMWAGIVFGGAVMAVGVLLVLDASLPGGFVEGAGTLPYAQTMAFTTVVVASMFAVFNARSDKESAFIGMFRNRWLWAAIGLSMAFQTAVIYTPFLQKAFSTVALSGKDWLLCTAVGSTVLLARELSKVVIFGATRRSRRR